MTDFASEREEMVERQLRRRGITEPEILDAFRAVPREAFISEEYAHLAYGDHPLPIEAEPDDLAALHRRADDPGRRDRARRHGARGRRRLGLCGGGDQPDRRARSSASSGSTTWSRSRSERLKRLGYDNVEIVEGDGTSGWPDAGALSTRSSPRRAGAMCRSR